ncbi:hypothetical protein E4U19_003223 [Claviceps sp. Clav32 group G5]|nr:hypothetical protein E4U19_003223 [Claviceps sp. Clav32 group G5]
MQPPTRCPGKRRTFTTQKEIQKAHREQVLLSPETFVSAGQVNDLQQGGALDRLPQGAFLVRDILKANSQKEGQMADYWEKAGQEA